MNRIAICLCLVFASTANAQTISERLAVLEANQEKISALAMRVENLQTSVDQLSAKVDQLLHRPMTTGGGGWGTTTPLSSAPVVMSSGYSMSTMSYSSGMMAAPRARVGLFGRLRLGLRGGCGG